MPKFFFHPTDGIRLDRAIEVVRADGGPVSRVGFADAVSVKFTA